MTFLSSGLVSCFICACPQAALLCGVVQDEPASGTALGRVLFHQPARLVSTWFIFSLPLPHFHVAHCSALLFPALCSSCFASLSCLPLIQVVIPTLKAQRKFLYPVFTCSQSPRLLSAPQLLLQIFAITSFISILCFSKHFCRQGRNSDADLRLPPVILSLE